MRASAERCLAVGVFDGVHLGHRAILDGVDKALTFSTHPLALIDPQRAPDLIMPLAERVEAIKACGVKEVEVLDFTPIEIPILIEARMVFFMKETTFSMRIPTCPYSTRH